jgi:hypothetical protein
MNKKLIIEMANKSFDESSFTDAEVLRFAKLVAEHERETIAKMIEDAPRLMDFVQNENGGCSICGFTPKIAAKSVREKWGRHE